MVNLASPLLDQFCGRILLPHTQPCILRQHYHSVALHRFRPSSTPSGQLNSCQSAPLRPRLSCPSTSIILQRLKSTSPSPGSSDSARTISSSRTGRYPFAVPPMWLITRPSSHECRRRSTTPSLANPSILHMCSSYARGWLYDQRCL